MILLEDVLPWSIGLCPRFSPTPCCFSTVLSSFLSSHIEIGCRSCFDGTAWQGSRPYICLTAVPLFHPPTQQSQQPKQYWFSCKPISGSVSRSADVFPRAAMMDSCRDIQCEWLMVGRHLWSHWRMDLSSLIYHAVCQCQYKCLMESTHSPLSETDWVTPKNLLWIPRSTVSTALEWENYYKL